MGYSLWGHKRVRHDLTTKQQRHVETTILLCSSPGDLPNPGIEPGSPALQTDALPSEPPGKQIETYQIIFFSSVSNLGEAKQLLTAYTTPMQLQF